jgi:hypothetical protein
MLLAMAMTVPLVRVLAIGASLGIWFWTQALLGRRSAGAPAGTLATVISDRIHLRTARINQHLNDNPRHANALLLSSSLVIDILGIYLLISAIFGPSIGPFLGVQILFALRQICQLYCPLPAPAGMIWRSPGFPTLLVTYGTSDDLFFSGHTAIAVYAAATLATVMGPAGIVLGSLIAGFEIAVVLLLRAHYTMDVFTGAITALYVRELTIRLAPAVDRWIAQAATLIHQSSP